MIKVLFGRPLRQTAGFVQSLHRLAGLDWPVPDFGTLGRAIWRGWSGYHRRSRVESKMTCITLLGHSPMARDFGRQVAELQVRIAVLNGDTALGMPCTRLGCP